MLIIRSIKKIIWKQVILFKNSSSVFIKHDKTTVKCATIVVAIVLGDKLCITFFATETRSWPIFWSFDSMFRKLIKIVLLVITRRRVHCSGVFFFLSRYFSALFDIYFKMYWKKKVNLPNIIQVRNCSGVQLKMLTKYCRRNYYGFPLTITAYSQFGSIRSQTK